MNRCDDRAGPLSATGSFDEARSSRLRATEKGFVADKGTSEGTAAFMNDPGCRKTMRANPPLLTLITDTGRYSGEPFFEVCDQALANGADAILVREKELTSAKLLALASRLRDITRKYRARLIIHTQADIAHAVDADGVHVASTDIATIPAIRSWLRNPEMSISASCHSAEELAQARHAGADFAMLAPVYPTQSHPGAPSLGVETFRTMAAQADIPVIALGGITTDNYQELAFSHLAVISAILDAENPGKAARLLSSGQHSMTR